jgi:DNA ligase-1
MKADEQLQQFVGADAVFLDTTYCHPRHLFPPQVQL